MRVLTKVCILCSFLLVASCSKQRQISINDAPLDEPSKTAFIQEGALFFRGFDDKFLPLKETPNPYADVVFVVPAGKHTIGAMNIQGGHFAMPDDLKCYKIEANLEAGVTYIITEDRDKHIAYVQRKDNEQRIGQAVPFESKTAYDGGCGWKK